MKLAVTALLVAPALAGCITVGGNKLTLETVLNPPIPITVEAEVVKTSNYPDRMGIFKHLVKVRNMYIKNDPLFIVVEENCPNGAVYTADNLLRVTLNRLGDYEFTNDVDCKEAVPTQ